MTIRNFAVSRRTALFAAGAVAAGVIGSRSARAQAKTIRLAHHVTTDSDQQRAAERFRDLLKTYTNGALTVQILPAGQMGGQREIIEAVSLGTLEMGYGESGLYANYVKRFGLLALPYLYRNADHWAAVVTGPIGKELGDELVGKAGLRIVNWINAGYRNTFLRTRAVKVPSDFKGLKIRVPESPVFVRTFSTFGATPTPIPAPEMYTSLQTGVVDAMEGSPEVGYTFKMFEVTKFLSKTEHILLDGSFAINETFFKSLPADQQSALMRAAAEAGETQRKEQPARDKAWFDKLTAGGMIVNDIDRPAFQDAVKALQDDFAKEAGAGALLAQIRSA
ncbi:TRAP transporter substrate-binding protein [Chelatococcus sp. GCM10030263]|uniref:TRAP transporter substrate-binding protein n=1 Tax=Chelatococcus sp. GCM10030263 TaxID=3273387 RepID=UPI00366E20B4